MNVYFLAFEAVMLVLFLLCLRHAWQQGIAVVSQLVTGVLFGLLLEWATIQQLEAYEYGRFALMLTPELPIMIGVGWGVIIYSARLFSDATDLPLWARPIFDALLALNIDFSMDTLAIRLGMWDWGWPFTYQYFGVPYSNFWAWFWVVFSFSSALRLITQIKRVGPWLAPVGALLFGVLGVLTTNAFIAFIVPPAWNPYVVFGLLGAAILLILLLRPQLYVRAVDPLVFWVPFAFHAYFLLAGALSGTLWSPPAILIIALVMSTTALCLHKQSWQPWLDPTK